MEVTLDKYGRIVIPKPVRDRLGLEPGSALELDVEPIEGGGEAIALRPADQEPVLQRKGHVLVHTGKADRPLDPVEAVVVRVRSASTSWPAAWPRTRTDRINGMDERRGGYPAVRLLSDAVARIQSRC